MSIEHKKSTEPVDWRVWEKLVLYKLDQLTTDVQAVKADVHLLQDAMIKHQSKTTYLGIVAGAIPVTSIALYFIINYLMG